MDSTVCLRGASGTLPSEKFAMHTLSMAHSSSVRPDISAGSAKIASWGDSCRPPAAASAGACTSLFTSGVIVCPDSSLMRLCSAEKPNSSQMDRRWGALVALTPRTSHCAARSRSRGNSRALASRRTSRMADSASGSAAPSEAPYTWSSMTVAAVAQLTPSSSSSRGSEVTAAPAASAPSTAEPSLPSRRRSRPSRMYVLSGALAAARTAWWAGRRSPPTTRARSQRRPLTRSSRRPAASAVGSA
mmetsp:Transcript_77667/g.240663  ORF Transcript_77667/g.240663 Transcript_77667/m.240663 type:complete len:245 (+) Transcript_77667:749-1483(+)